MSEFFIGEDKRLANALLAHKQLGLGFQQVN